MIRQENSQVANSFENYQTPGKNVAGGWRGLPAKVALFKAVSLFGLLAGTWLLLLLQLLPRGCARGTD